MRPGSARRTRATCWWCSRRPPRSGSTERLGNGGSRMTTTWSSSSGRRYPRRSSEERGTGIELPSARQGLPGRVPVACLDLEADLDEPELPVIGRPLNRLIEIAIRCFEIAAQLLDERELEARLRRPRFERDRVAGILRRRLQISSIDRVLAVADLHLAEEEETSGPDRRDARHHGANAEREPPSSSTPAWRGRSKPVRQHGRRSGEERGGEHNRREAGGELPRPVEGRRDEARRQDGQRGADLAAGPAAIPSGQARDDRDREE